MKKPIEFETYYSYRVGADQLRPKIAFEILADTGDVKIYCTDSDHLLRIVNAILGEPEE